MTGELGEATSRSPQNPSCSSNNGSNNNSGDAGNFECNICFDLAQDPIVTLCGHLFCWPCLYKWLHIHSHSQECPVCKALVEEEKLVPLYGRGKTPTDPRSKSVPGVDIPNRPAGQRPETAPPPDRNAFAAQQGFGFMGGFGPSMTTSFGNFTLSFGGLLPSFFNVQMHTFGGSPMYGNGAVPGYSYGAHPHEAPQHRGHTHHHHHHHQSGFSAPSPLIIIGLLVLWYLLS